MPQIAQTSCSVANIFIEFPRPRFTVLFFYLADRFISYRGPPLSEVMDELRSLENSAQAAEAFGSRPHDLRTSRRGKSLVIEPVEALRN